MTIMIPLAKAAMDDCLSLIKNYSFIRPLEFMFKSSKDDVTAFTSDIVKLLKVRCNFGSTGINNESQTNPNGCGLTFFWCYWVQLD